MTTNLQREEKCPQCGGYLREWFDHQVSTGFKCDDCQLELKEIPTNPPTETVSDCCGAGFHTQSNAGIDNDTVDKICNKCGNPCLTIVNPPKEPTGEHNKHWWLKSKKFKRVRLSTIERLALLYSAECFGKKPPYSHDFVIWLENYMEEI